MTSTSPTSGARLVRPEAGPVARHLSAGVTVATLVALTAIGWSNVPIALLAAGAGAGYSLSGSV